MTGLSADPVFIPAGIPGIVLVLLLLLTMVGCGNGEEVVYDTVIQGGTIYDGSGAPPFVADIGIRDGKIAAIGNLSGRTAGTIVGADRLAVAPDDGARSPIG